MQIELRLITSDGAPVMCCGGRLNAVGCLVRERVASMAVDWPALGFHCIEPGARTLRVVVTTACTMPAAVVGLALIRAIRRETADVVCWGE